MRDDFEPVKDHWSIGKMVDQENIPRVKNSVVQP